MKSEVIAVNRYNRFGRSTLEAVLERISVRAHARMKNQIDYTASADCWISVNTAFHWLTKTERAVTHSIQLALMLCTNPAAEARERNKRRMLEKRKQQKLKSKIRNAT